MSVDDVRLTRTEAEAQGLMRRDPIRRMSDEHLEAQRLNLENMHRLFHGTSQQWRCEGVLEVLRKVRREQRRRNGSRAD